MKYSYRTIILITKEVFEKGKESGWIGNEIAWARDSTPNKNMAIFVQKGCKASGLAGVVADNLEFDPKKIETHEEKITSYLRDLKSRVVGGR